MDNYTGFGETTDPRRTAVVWPNETSRAGELAALAMLAGCAVVQHEPASEADFLLVDLCSDIDRPADSLSEIVGYLLSHRSTALVWTDMAGLDVAYAALPQRRCHFLVDANDAEAMPILTGALGQRKMERLHDRNRELEFGSLHRMSDELAEFARTLSRMAEQDRGSGLADKPVSFRPAPVGGFQPFSTSAAAAAPRTDPRAIRDMIKLRRLRDSFFDAQLFADPAWDILLDLMAARLEGCNVSVSSLCIAAAVPPTTALRWITAMTESGILLRQQDPADARRVFIILSDKVAQRLDDYFAAAHRYSAQTG